MAKIKYVGKKAKKDDNVANTGLTWRPGEVLEVNDEIAVEKLLRHKDVWQQVAESTPAAKTEPKNPSKPKGKYEEEEVAPPPVVNFQRMGKDALDNYARVHLSLKVDQRHKLPDIRAQVKAAYDRAVAVSDPAK